MWTVIVDIKNRERGIDKVEAAAGAQAAQDRHADDVPNHDHAAERMQQDPGAGAAAGAQAGQDRHGIQLLQDVFAVCGVEVTGKSQCSGCHSVNYCSREHQKEHWRTGGHREACQKGAAAGAQAGQNRHGIQLDRAEVESVEAAQVYENFDTIDIMIERERRDADQVQHSAAEAVGALGAETESHSDIAAPTGECCISFTLVDILMNFLMVMHKKNFASYGDK